MPLAEDLYTVVGKLKSHPNPLWGSLARREPGGLMQNTFVDWLTHPVWSFTSFIACDKGRRRSVGEKMIKVTRQTFFNLLMLC